MAKKKLYTINLTYTMTHIMEVEAGSAEEAKAKAKDRFYMEPDLLDDVIEDIVQVDVIDKEDEDGENS